VFTILLAAAVSSIKAAYRRLIRAGGLLLPAIGIFFHESARHLGPYRMRNGTMQTCPKLIAKSPNSRTKGTIMRKSVSEMILTIGISVLSIVIDCMEKLLWFAMDLTERFSGQKAADVESKRANDWRCDFPLHSDDSHAKSEGGEPNHGLPPNANES
jgi:hypothetical protein